METSALFSMDPHLKKMDPRFKKWIHCYKNGSIITRMDPLKSIIETIDPSLGQRTYCT